jgi:hypothetical protein
MKGSIAQAKNWNQKMNPKGRKRTCAAAVLITEINKKSFFLKKIISSLRLASFAYSQPTTKRRVGYFV